MAKQHKPKTRRYKFRSYAVAHKVALDRATRLEHNQFVAQWPFWEKSFFVISQYMMNTLCIRRGNPSFTVIFTWNKNTRQVLSSSVSFAGLVLSAKKYPKQQSSASVPPATTGRSGSLNVTILDPSSLPVVPTGSGLIEKTNSSRTKDITDGPFISSLTPEGSSKRTISDLTESSRPGSKPSSQTMRNSSGTPPLSEDQAGH